MRGAGPAPAAGRDAAGPAAGGATVDSPAATAAVAPTAQRIEDEVGPIDGWVTVAFTSVFSPFCDIKPAEFKRVTDVSYLGYVDATIAVSPFLQRRNRGTIVQVGSALAYRGDSAVDRLLRRGARDSRFQRGPALRAVACHTPEGSRELELLSSAHLDELASLAPMLETVVADIPVG